MKNIIDLYEASLLGDIDDTLASGDEYTQKKEIVEWLEDNFDFVVYGINHKENEDLFKDPKSLKLNSKGEINVRNFRPYYNYAEKPNKFLDLPVPEYIKINTVSDFDIVGDMGDLAKIDFNKLPKIEKCNNIFIRCWGGRRNKTWLPALSKLDINEIGLMTIDIEGIHPQDWPKKNVKAVYLFANTITNYNRDHIKDLGYNYDLHKLSGLSTDELIVPDCCITENISLILTQRAIKKDIVIDKENFPREWKNINLIFDSKSFKKLYVYSAAVHAGDHKFKEIKRVGNTFIIKARATNVLNKYYE